MSARIKVVRHSDRGVYNEETAFSILDEGMVCHVAFMEDGVPYNLPMIYVRIGKFIYLHGSVKSRIYKVLAAGQQACVTVTILDGVVLAKSAYNSSMNYRSTMVYGRMRPVDSNSRKLQVLEGLTEKMMKGRWQDCRRPTEEELKITGILELEIGEFSSKIRNGDPIDNLEDQPLNYWSGVIPLEIVHGEPQSSPDVPAGNTVPDYLRNK